MEKKDKLLREKGTVTTKAETVRVPEEFKPVFDTAQKTVGKYFKKLITDPTRGTIEIGDQRYILVRASALSYDFLNTIKNLYADQGEKNAFLIGKNFLFDIAHVIGMNDAKNFHDKMKLTDPIAKLSAGPVHFAYSGWAFVHILTESNPSPDNNYFLKYHHPFSFEADSWIKAGKKSDFPVCIMNAGYSSGWCEESFGIPLTAVEITCKAKGDDNCTFIMAPPDKIKGHIGQYKKKVPQDVNRKIVYDIPTFFERKNTEEKLRISEEKYRAIYDYANIGISRVSIDGEFIDVNQRLCEITGYTEKELYKMKFMDITHPDDFKKSMIFLNDFLQGKHSINSIEKRYIHKNGSTIYANLTVTLVHDKNGEPGYFVSVIEDITGKKKTEELLKKSLREKEILLNEVNHRCKNNLQIISSMLSLQASNINNKSAIKILKTSQDRIMSMAFVHECLYETKDFSKINISEYIENLSDNLVRSYKTQYNSVNLKLDTDKMELNLDTAIPCGIIINELVSNSLKHAFPDNHKGEIKITLKKKNTGFILTISDNGIGFPSRHNIKKPGSLGLQLVHALVEQVNGKIKIFNNNGTKYNITFAAKNPSK